MAGSQLKRLKASLREQGVVGPQQSKKQKRKNAQDQKARGDKRLQRSVVLDNIREQFNPFQFKTSARGPKFEVTTNRPADTKVVGRPGLSKSAGEEKRRQTLLVEMQRRNKVGGVLDRRFGEDDPTMTPEEKMLERFAREKQKNYKKNSSVFDLEADESEGLTHMGRTLSFEDLEEEGVQDDFDEADLPSGDESDGSQSERKRLKRLRQEAGEEDGDEKEEPERKKTKKEVMEEVMAKSKHHKYERQAAKEADDDLRAEIDKELPDLQALLFRQNKRTDEPGAAGVDKAAAEKAAMEKDYDVRLRQMIQDKRAQPSTRTKTEEEKAAEESNRLRELEEQRLRRMAGQESESESESEEKPEQNKAAEEDEFGLGRGIKMRATATELGFDDEDDFVIDDGLVASGSDIDEESDQDTDGSDQGSEDSESKGDEDSDDEFTKGLLTEAESKGQLFQTPSNAQGNDDSGVPYTFPCPQTHTELVEVLQTVPVASVPTAVQRIRALYHPKLDGRNKEKLGNFARALVRHIPYLADGALSESPPMDVLESLVRHAHSLAKMFPIEVAGEYRAHIEDMSRSRPLALGIGDLVVLTAVGTTFSASDHFHQVATPATLAMARYLGHKVPSCAADYATGTYLSMLALEYQKLSRRFVPEVVNFCLNTLCALAPEKPAGRPGFFPVHEPPADTRIREAASVRKLGFGDCRRSKDDFPSTLKMSILSTTVAVLRAAAETWTGQAAFIETFSPALAVLEHLGSGACRERFGTGEAATTISQAATFFSRALRAARLARRPLELHHHRPQAIRTQVPRFEERFDPNKHYDPDRERAELAKLRAEHKRERRGAMRELRGDAAFLARENLRRKRERDEAYERKYRRLVADIQSQEGRAANEYEREKAARKRAQK